MRQHNVLIAQERSQRRFLDSRRKTAEVEEIVAHSYRLVYGQPSSDAVGIKSVDYSGIVPKPFHDERIRPASWNIGMIPSKSYILTSGPKYQRNS